MRFTARCFLTDSANFYSKIRGRLFSAKIWSSVLLRVSNLHVLGWKNIKNGFGTDLGNKNEKNENDGFSPG